MANVTTQQQQEIVKLRALHLTPKQIARQLGLKVSDVNTAIQHQAEETALNRKATGELDPVYQCLASSNLIRLLTDNSEFKNLKSSGGNITRVDDDNLANGLGLVVIAREGRYNDLSVCSYLLDYWCLGVKDTITPRKINQAKYKEFIEKMFDAFPGQPQEISISVAQGIIYSVLEYADKLGFQPHRDFAESRLHAGEWNNDIRIRCGRKGKPFYVNGPYDTPTKVIQTLKNSVGEGNFDYLLGSGEPF